MATEYAQREFDAYRADDAAARAILDAADEAKRSTTPEEDEQFDKLLESAAKHKERADKLVKSDKDAEALGEAVRSRLGDVDDPKSGRAGETRGGLNLEIITSIRSAGDLLMSGKESPEAWLQGVVDLQKRDEAIRAIADFSDNGALYTTDFYTTMAVYQRTASPWINLATVINADNGRPLNLPNLTADPTAYTPGEGTAITEATSTIGSAALTTTAYKALAYVSAEAEEDELVGLMGLIAKSQGRSIGLKFGSDLTVVVVAAAQNGGTATGTGGAGTAVSAFFGYEDLIDLKYSRAVPYRQAGVWIMSNGAIKKVRKFRDQNFAYFWQPAIGPGMPATFDGDPVYEDPYLAAPASATKSVLYGDASAVVIKQMPVRVATSTDFRFSNDQVALKTVYRAGGALPDVAALAFLVSANT